jgi:ribonucleotide monophosphatase NagD (HAD superfamily)
VRALEAASDRDAVIVGKPEPQLLIPALDRLGERPTLVVGDRIDSDLAAAGKAHHDGALVLTGGLTREEAEAARDPRPVAVADTLAQLVNGHGP